MIIFDIINPIIALVASIACFLVTNNIYCGIGIGVMFLLHYFLILRKKFKNYYSLIERVHTGYHFINSFLITLSVKESFEDAYQNGIRINNKNLKDQVNNLNNLSVYDRVKYLRKYFNLSIYKMFLNILDLYQDQGGNILNMSDNLLRECTRTEKILSETLSIGNKHLVEFLLLWIMSFGILIFIRFGIADVFDKMLNNPVMVPLFVIYFVICLISIHMFFTSFTNISIKEDSGS